MHYFVVGYLGLGEGERKSLIKIVNICWWFVESLGKLRIDPAS